MIYSKYLSSLRPLIIYQASNAVTVAAQAADSCALKDSQIALEQSNKRAEELAGLGINLYLF